MNRFVKPRKKRKENLRPGKAILTDPNYYPDRLLDVVAEKLGLRYDVQLCRLANINQPYVSRVRNRRQVISAEMLVALHEATDMPIRELLKLAGLPSRFGWETA
jgi:transcriptional regulator with XRE-family HTH domain